MYLVRWETVNKTIHYQGCEYYDDAKHLCETMLSHFAIQQVAIYCDNNGNLKLKYIKIKHGGIKNDTKN